jgi:DNA-binding CsgD family transcriptional regulator
MARRQGEPTIEHQACGFLASIVLHTGQFSEALQVISRGLIIAKRLKQRYWQGHLSYVGQWISHLQGDWVSTRSYSEQAIETSARSPIALLSRLLTEYEFGDFDEWDAYIQEAVNNLRQTSEGRNHEYALGAVQLAFIDYLTGKQDWSEIITDAADYVLESGPKDGYHGYCVKTALALVAINQGDAVAAREWHDILIAPFKLYRERGIIFAIFTSSDRILGLLSLTSGEIDQAIVHFKDARSHCLHYGFIPQLGWSCYDYARTLLLRGRKEDVRKASELKTEAKEIATRLGMTVLEQKVTSLDTGITPRKPASPKHHLTNREIEVIRLLAKGMTNREIASELNISEHTAATHVRKILHKADLANRTEAAAYAVKNNLTVE